MGPLKHLAKKEIEEDVFTEALGNAMDAIKKAQRDISARGEKITLGNLFKETIKNVFENGNEQQQLDTGATGGSLELDTGAATVHDFQRIDTGESERSEPADEGQQ